MPTLGDGFTSLSTRWAQLGGVRFNAIDPDGTRWVMGKGGVAGWPGSPAGTLAPVQKPRNHGAWAGDSFLQARHLTIAGIVSAASPELLLQAADRLNTAVSLDEQLLTVSREGVERSMRVRRSDDVIMPFDGDGTWSTFSLQLVALDPRKYGDELTGSTALPMSSGGLTVPFAVPFSINSTIGSGQVNLTNPGNVASNVRLRISGPVAGPVVTHVNSGVQLVFSSSLTLAAGEWIDVDVEARTVLAQGQPGASRAGWVTSRGWALFEPGDNTWAFAAAAYDPDARLTVTASPSWL